MLLKLSLRHIQLSDIGPDCPYFPEEGEYEMRFNAIVEDIEAIDSVASAVASGSNEITVSITDLDLKDFKEALKPFLLRDYQYLRLDDIAKV